MIALHEIATVLRNGKSVRQSSDAGGLPITRIETIADGTINPTRVGYADLIENDAIGWLLQDGDILISHINSTKHLGKCAIYEGFPEKLVHGMNLLALRVDQRIAYPKYVHYTLSSAPFRRQLPRITKNSVNQSSFNISSFKKLRLPLPPLPEQKRIAKILDAADALRAKRRESLAQLDALLQSTFLEMFGDPVENPKGWAVKSLGEIAARKPNNGIFRKNPAYLDNSQSGLPVVWVGELFRGNEIHVSSSRRLDVGEKDREKYGLEFGDILFCRSSLKLDGIAFNNVYLGKTREALFECHLIRLSPNQELVNPRFLNMLLRTSPLRAALKSKAKTATMTTIDQKALMSVQVTVPPIDTQKQFSKILDSAEAHRSRLHSQVEELICLSNSLQARAFNGRI